MHELQKNHSLSPRQQHGFDFVCRAHQVVDYGYEFFGKRRLVTVFTASNYCGDYGNRGGVLTVDKDLKCNFVILLPNGGSGGSAGGEGDEEEEEEATFTDSGSTTEVEGDTE